MRGLENAISLQIGRPWPILFWILLSYRKFLDESCDKYIDVLQFDFTVTGQ